MSDKLLLIDGHSIINRAFYGLPDLTNAEGLHTGAVYGFLNILLRFIDEEKPAALAVAFDVHAPTFRHEMYAEYKGKRKPMPEELRSQVPLLKEVLDDMGVYRMEQAGLEADDLLGTAADERRPPDGMPRSSPETEICCRSQRTGSSSHSPRPCAGRPPSHATMRLLSRPSGE